MMMITVHTSYLQVLSEAIAVLVVLFNQILLTLQLNIVTNGLLFYFMQLPGTR